MGILAMLAASQDRQGRKQAVDVRVAALQVPLPRTLRWLRAVGRTPRAPRNAVRACRTRVLSKIRQSPGASRRVSGNSGPASSEAHAR